MTEDRRRRTMSPGRGGIRLDGYAGGRGVGGEGGVGGGCQAEIKINRVPQGDNNGGRHGFWMGDSAGRSGGVRWMGMRGRRRPRALRRSRSRLEGVANPRKRLLPRFNQRLHVHAILTGEYPLHFAHRLTD